MNYKKLYNILYKEGYHIDILTNIGSKFVNHLVDSYQFDSILDVGCSQGLAVQQYQISGKDAYGIDISKIGVDKAKELGINNCKVASILNIPFDDNNFDAVSSSDVLEHLEESDVEKAINEICRVSKKYLFLKIASKKEGNRKWIAIIKEKYAEEFPGLDNLHLSVHNHTYWIEQIEKAGKFKFKEINNRFLIFERI
jgi:ubiquinone/menaquinone biosynthesis C-methylase UbiE